VELRVRQTAFFGTAGAGDALQASIRKELSQMSTAKKLLVRAAAESQVGNARGNNEDNVYFNGDFITPRTIRQDFAIKTGDYSDINVFAVLDGMGRNNTGSFASLLGATRLDVVSSRVAFDSGKDTDTIVLEYMQSVNGEVREQIKETGGVRTASTIALVIIENGVVHAYNAGDSRVYLFRDKQLIRLSRDHISIKGQQSVALTEEGVRNGGLTKYLGMPEAEGPLEPFRAKPFKMRKGDKLLICSDGLTDYVDEEDIASCMARNREPFAITNELMILADREDSADNVSVIVAEVTEPGIHISDQNVLVMIAAAILVAGLIIGTILGYIIGRGTADSNTGFIDYTAGNNTQQTNHSDTVTPPPQQFTSGSDVSASDMQNQNSSNSTASTLYPTTTYPTSTTAPIMIESMTLQPDTEFTIRVGDTYKMGILLMPEDTDLSVVVWTSSDEKVATVDENGVITAVGRGSAKITATVGDPENGGLYEEVLVRVKNR